MPAPLAALFVSLESELAAVRDFRALLDDERTALLGGDADLLPPLTERKSALVQQLTARARERASQLTLSGLPAGREGIRAVCAGAPAAVRRIASELVECAGRAQSLNEQNRMLVELRLQHVSSALAVLVGSAPSSLGATYSSDGRARANPRGRDLATA